MAIKDLLLALCVVVAWGVNFVVIKVGLHGMPPFLLAGLRFTRWRCPRSFRASAAYSAAPAAAVRAHYQLWSVRLSVLAINLGMPAGLASLVLQAQAFFTLLLGALLLAEKLRWYHIAGIAIATGGMVLLATAGQNASAVGGVTLTTMLMTLAAALCWGMGNITNRVIMRSGSVPIMSLVVWSALVPIGPFSPARLFEGRDAIAESLMHIQLTTILALIYPAFIATVVGYGIWGSLLGRYETARGAALAAGAGGRFVERGAVIGRNAFHATTYRRGRCRSWVGDECLRRALETAARYPRSAGITT